MSRRGKERELTDGSTFARWFLDRELEPSASMGIASERAELHLCRAIAFLERGMLREALNHANAAAHLDEALRASALVVARACIRRQLEEDDS